MIFPERSTKTDHIPQSTPIKSDSDVSPLHRLENEAPAVRPPEITRVLSQSVSASWLLGKDTLKTSERVDQLQVNQSLHAKQESRFTEHFWYSLSFPTQRWNLPSEPAAWEVSHLRSQSSSGQSREKSIIWQVLKPDGGQMVSHARIEHVKTSLNIVGRLLRASQKKASFLVFFITITSGQRSSAMKCLGRHMW